MISSGKSLDSLPSIMVQIYSGASALKYPDNGVQTSKPMAHPMFNNRNEKVVQNGWFGSVEVASVNWESQLTATVQV